MSFQNRKEEYDKAMALEIGQEFDFNMFQELGASIKRVSENEFELSEVKYSGDMYHDTYTKENLMDAINLAYDEWT